MISQRCGLSRSQFVELSRGLGGTGAVRAIATARHSGTMLLLKYVADHGPAARAAFDLLTSVAEREPATVHDVLRHPTVGAWLRRTAAQLREGATDHTGELAFVAAAAALRAGVRATVDLPAGERIPLPSLGIAPGPVPAGAMPVAELEWRPTPKIVLSGGTFELGGWAPRWQPTGLPLADVVDAGSWQQWLAAAWHLLADGHPAVAAELAAAVSMFAPLRPTAGSVSSAILADAFGCVFLSLVTDPEQLAVTLAHELQHTKLSALLDLFPLLSNGSGETFYAPWRNDPRPAHGLLHGCYAYHGVTGFWRTRAATTGSRHAYQEFARWRVATLNAVRVLLDSGLPTELGRLFLTGMAEVLESWCTEPVPRAAGDAAEEQAEAHRSRWLDQHGGR